MRRRSLFGYQLLVTVGANVGLGAIAILTGILASRLLGPTGRGELAAIQLWAGFLAILAMAGLPEAVVYFSAKKPEDVTEYLASALALGLALSMVFVGFGYLFIPYVLQSQSNEVILAARSYLLFIPVTVALTIGYQALRGSGHFRLWNLLRFLPSLIWLSVLTISWISSHATPVFLAYGNLLGLALLLPIVALVLHRTLGGWGRPSRKLWSPLVRFGLPTVLAAVPSLLNLRLDQLIIAAILPSTSLGHYAVAVTWSTILTPITTAVGLVIFPRVASVDGRAQQIDLLSRVSRLSLATSAALALPLALVTSFMLPFLFGADFAPSILPAIVLVGASVIASLNGILEDGTRGMGYPKLSLQAELIGLIATGLALYLMLPVFEILGAAFASVLGYASVTAVLLFRLWKLTEVSPAGYLVLNLQDVSLVVSSIRAVQKSR